MTDHLGGHCYITHTDVGTLMWLKEYLQSEQPLKFLDVGCSMGWQLSLAKNTGYDVAGIEGDISIKSHNELKCKENIIWHDLTKTGLILEKQYDVIWCVEVAEHIEEKYVNNLLNTLCFNLNSNGLLVFTFCDKPDTGIHHVNIQKEEYWLNKFSDYGIIKDEGLTEILRNRTTMVREFIKETGIILRNRT